MSPSFIKVLIDGQPLPDFLDTLDCTITHELNRHSNCSVQFREPPAARFFYESSMMGNDHSPYRIRQGDVIELEKPAIFGKETRLIKMPVSWTLDD